MRPCRLFPVLLLLLCARAWAAPLPALSIVPNTGTVIVTARAACWQFTSRPLSEETPLTHTFLLRNTSKAPLTIERVAVSCDCVQAIIGETRSLPAQIAPGQTVPVQVSLSPRRLAAGPVSKSAWLYLHGGSEAAVRLELRGVVRDDPTAKPN